MAEDKDDNLTGDMKVAAAKTPARSFAPSTGDTLVTASASSPPRSKPSSKAPDKFMPLSGVPSGMVDPKLVMEFVNEISDKVMTGRGRMRWFANHLILFAVFVAIAVPMQLFVFTDIEPDFFLLPLAAWVGILAIHARYAMGPILKRSAKEGQLQGVVPSLKTADPDQHEMDLENK